MKPVLYCATTNADKLREFRLTLAEYYEIEQALGIRDIPAPEETGDTFEANAALKAIYYSQHCAEPVFADDSGIEVDALNGEPGVRSARYAGEHASNEDNNRLLLERMQGQTQRTARFVCAIALASGGRLIRTFRGTVEGELLHAPRGRNGFGYDPLFFHAPFGCSFGEASDAQKTQVSHRAQALRSMLAYLQSSTGNIQ